MTTPKDGGPAFPHIDPINEHGQGQAYEGMSLRQYYAGQVAGQCFKEIVAKYGWGNWDAIYTETAAAAKGIADAMIEEKI